jgi:thiosulfate dehydrogenase
MPRSLIGFVLGLLFMPAVAAVIALTGHFPIQATARPPGWEGRIASMALDPAIEKLAAGLEAPVVTDEDLMRGMKIYREGCAGCHGDHGKPSAWGRNNFYPPTPQLAESGMDDPVPDIFVMVKYGIRYTGMAGWKDQLTDADLWRVAAFLNRMESLPPAVKQAWDAAAGAEPPEKGAGATR